MRECLSTFPVAPGWPGSFDSVDASLRAASTALRMTERCYVTNLHEHCENEVVLHTTGQPRGGCSHVIGASGMCRSRNRGNSCPLAARTPSHSLTHAGSTSGRQMFP